MIPMGRRRGGLPFLIILILESAPHGAGQKAASAVFSKDLSQIRSKKCVSSQGMSSTVDKALEDAHQIETPRELVFTQNRWFRTHIMVGSKVNRNINGIFKLLVNFFPTGVLD